MKNEVKNYLRKHCLLENKDIMNKATPFYLLSVVDVSPAIKADMSL